MMDDVIIETQKERLKAYRKLATMKRVGMIINGQAFGGKSRREFAEILC